MKIFFLSITCFFMLCANSFAQSGTISGSDLTWSLNDSILTISGSGEMPNFSSPPWYSYRLSIKEVVIEDEVTSIGNYAFNSCTGITSIIIPDSVTSIGNNAFNGCTGLTSITIPESVTSIGSYAFGSCRNLTSISIPNSVTRIGDNVFNGCTGLSSITIPESVISIGSSAFGSCRNLTSITIPNSVTSIGNNAFSGCTGLSSITISENVTSIGNNAFSGCTGLTSITIPDSVTSIGYSAFYDCTKLQTVNFNAANCTLMHDDISPVFEGCSSFTTLNIGNSVTRIPDYAFFNCSSLTSVNISEGVTIIGDYAFWYCENLTSISIPNSVTSIGVGAFDGCNLATIDVENNHPNYSVIAGVLFSKNQDTLICYPVGKIGESYEIPSSVTTIGADAFYGCKNLTSITFATPENVTSIGNGVFIYSGITSFDIPNGVKTIGDGTFANCSSLTSIIIPEGITSIGEGAFAHCSSLESIVIPANVTSIGGYAFVESGLTSITILLTNVIETGQGIFANCENLISITSFNPIPPLFEYESDTFWNWGMFGSCTLIVPTMAVTEYRNYYGNYFWRDIIGGGYLVNPIANNNEGYTTGNGLYEEGEEATVAATANKGYKFVNWTKDGVEVSVDNSYSFEVTEDIELVANFEIDNTTAVETIKAPVVKVYPNPTTGIVYTGTIESNIKVCNLQGEILQSIVGNKVDLSAYPQGLYLLQVDGEWTKVVKK